MSRNKKYLLILAIAIVVISIVNLLVPNQFLSNLPWLLIIIYGLELLYRFEKVKRNVLITSYFAIYLGYMRIMSGYYDMSSWIIFIIGSLCLTEITSLLGRRLRKE